MQYIFIVNSNIHKRRKKALEKAVRELPADFRNKSEIVYTERSNHAEELAVTYSEKYGSECLIFACGGDGTVHEVANALAFRNSPMAVIPLGTGNDFARTIYSKEQYKDPLSILKKLANPGIRSIDLLRIDSYDLMGNHLPFWSRYSLNIASMGLDTMVQAKAKRIVAKHPKSLFFRNNAYTFAAVSCLIRGWRYTMDYSIELEDGEMVEKKNVRYSLVSICNGRCYGGGFCPAPDAKVDDGVLDVCIVDHMSRIKAFSQLMKYKKGKHIGKPGFTCYRSTSGIFTSLNSNLQMQGNYDGEDFYGHRVRYEVVPQAIQLAFFS
ncbi:MAG: hypothetical protein J5379_07735 [Clostridiales bacterium]|nr:hypothetical protein [Clostridiales bacterium]